MYTQKDADNFLKEVLVLAKLPKGTKFKKGTDFSSVSFSLEDLKKLRKMCEKDSKSRLGENLRTGGFKFNEQWSYSVIEKYFKIK
jgi:hypothetical protein